MKIEKAYKILRQYQDWRMGADKPMQDPKLITEAIELILKQNRK